MQLPSNVWALVGANWQRTPFRAQNHHTLAVDDLFKTFTRGCELFRQGKVTPPAKIFADGNNKENVLDGYLPLEGETFLDYDHRMTKEYGHESYLVYAFDMSPYDEQFAAALRGFRDELCNHSDQNHIWGPVVAELFLGRYKTTVGGVHKERCATFHYVLHGKKLIRTWPESSWDISNERVRYSSDERTGEAEHYLLDVQFDDKNSVSTDLIGTGGDMFYWPEGWWHVGQSEGLTCALTVALHPKPSAVTENVNG